jgi:hypothetical protein
MNPPCTFLTIIPPGTGCIGKRVNNHVDKCPILSLRNLSIVAVKVDKVGNCYWYPGFTGCKADQSLNCLVRHPTACRREIDKGRTLFRKGGKEVLKQARYDVDIGFCNGDQGRLHLGGIRIVGHFVSGFPNGHSIDPPTQSAHQTKTG